MKKVVVNAVLLGLLVVSVSSCEKNNIDEEISSEELQLVDPDDDGTIDEGDIEEY